jgi:hypothetical protein
MSNSLIFLDNTSFGRGFEPGTLKYEVRALISLLQFSDENYEYMHCWSSFRFKTVESLVHAAVIKAILVTPTIVSQLIARYWPLVAVLTVQIVPHRKHTPSP